MFVLYIYRLKPYLQDILSLPLNKKCYKIVSTCFFVNFFPCISFLWIVPNGSVTINEEESNFTLESVNTSIKVPQEVMNSSKSLFFTTYRRPALFQVAPPSGLNQSTYNITTDSMVLGFSPIPVNERNFTNLSSPIIITLQSIRARNNEVSTTFPIISKHVICVHLDLVRACLCVMGLQC